MRLVHYTYPSIRRLAPLTGGFQRSPWAGLETEMDRLFESALGAFTPPTSGRFALDLFEDKANTYVRAELPGLSREDISVEVIDGYLTIAATRKAPAPTEKAKAGEAKAEEAYSFSRSVSIGEDVQTDKISAAYENGVLTVTLPKRETVQPKKIAVTVK